MDREYTTNEVKTYIDRYLLDTHQAHILIYRPDLELYTDGEIEYQVRSYGCNQFSSILVRYCADTTHCYSEFWEYQYDSIEDLIYEAFSEETADVLNYKVERTLIHLRAEKNEPAKRTKSIIDKN